MKQQFSIRRALATDRKNLKRLVRASGINRYGIHWNHFYLAVNGNGRIIGCGQLKPHRDGSLELASLAVQKRWRGRGVARCLIEELIQASDSHLWLICGSKLMSFYGKYGFKAAYNDLDKSRYFRRFYRISSIIRRIHRPKNYTAIMYRRAA